MKEFTVTLYRGKRFIWPAAIRFFSPMKRVPGACCGPKWPTWNTPKKGSLSRKRLKEDERVGRGHFHERGDESPARCGRFGANGSSLAHFVPEIRPFEKKRAGINNSV